MKLESISVSKHRSIIDATRIELGELTVLVGKNNEGKSNFLRAMSVAFDAVRSSASDSGISPAVARLLRVKSPESYSYLRDFPLSLQG